MAGLVPVPVSSAAATTSAPLAPVVLPKTSESEQLLKIRHSMSHVMAMAVQKLFPNAQVTIGPWTETGFYYDFDNPEPFTEDDLKAIKKEMGKIIGRKLPLERIEVSRDEAETRIKAQNEPYKLEILERLQEPITLYTLGDQWWDLCAGPHVENTKELHPKAFELESVAGAYWRGDETKAQLQRIYGTAWETPEQLAEHKRRKVEALRRDHRRLGKDLELFSIEDEAGAGLVFWHPRGARMRLLIEDFWRQAHFEGGYELLYTPHVADISLWKTSGHLDFYAESMFGPMQVDEREYQLKPMNCPFHVLTYASKLRSYRELPIRWAELGTVYRYERPGVMHGLMRVRGFTQDDAHVFCLPDQISDEILRILDLTERILSTFDFNHYEINLSTRPEKSIGSEAVWELATKGLTEALERKGWNFKIDEGGGAFYGPKIDLKIEDAIGRMWQCSTIQLDFNLPERFGLDYVAADGSKQQPIMIHRAIFGSLERFFGIMTENYAGDFPFWLAPEQIRLLPVTDDVQPYAEQVLNQLKTAGIRATIDQSGDRLGKIIRTGEQMKIPVLAVIGAKEAEQNAISLRSRRDGDLGVTSVDALLKAAQRANAERQPGLGLNP
ncbi:threonyl-tRNA synthetase / Ser-tRNA(Thr) hydrolase [Synechococcus sp. CC9902]|jgi:threonyl-tRNA synthetase|uniref:Threonine--tRNA ligase n=1 Tax=Synechococcus sp. (strain CC9902) TaxID=316279 RepID=SYT_SYNS9|nr:threonine--tRNA ligase [Synechococcus sp. CC9902]Q3AYC6.1 RecName: Full=Threonine--tRNA ligase; AltName: Full=Threonyl-tRNA synthetase; Short=ThrRS [Synechococcus sp. CC9902]ABB25901.1 threonyl-tRNA synthetase / Ser-tRNA(Thr) hydrolase [Synechococcus sp. CC9902]MDG2192161.1 threonine--tRNA ligase [Synechococcus sp. cluster2_bin.209]